MANSTHSNLPHCRSEAGEISTFYHTSKPIRSLQSPPSAGFTTGKSQTCSVFKSGADPLDADIFTSKLLA